MTMNATPEPGMKPNRNYGLLLAGQFLSAFGDNAILALILGPVLVAFGKGTMTAREQQYANIIYTSLLFVPYVILAPLAGYWNDRFAKTRWLTGGNLLKLAGTAVCAMGATRGTVFLGLGYFLVGVGACAYSPAKYGILPEILPSERLVKANGTVELLTLVAILMGTISGAWIFDHWPLGACYGVVIGVYGLSMALNMLMIATPPHPEVRLAESFGGFFQNARWLLAGRRLARVLLGTSVFWICGAMMKMNFQPWGQQVLKFQTATQVALLGLWLSVGIMAGSVLAGQFYKVGELRATRRWGWLLSAAIACLGCVHWLGAHGLQKGPYFSEFDTRQAARLAEKLAAPTNSAAEFMASYSPRPRPTLRRESLIPAQPVAGLPSDAMTALTNRFDEAGQKRAAQWLQWKFNAVIEYADLSGDVRFASYPLRAEAREMLKDPAFQSKPWMNRLLLDEAFPNELAQDRYAYLNRLSIVILILAGLMAGLFLIPLNAALQAESHQDKLGKTIATQNFFENAAMIAGSVLAIVNVRIGLDPSQLFLGLAAFVCVAAAFLKIPEKTSADANHDNNR